MKEIPQIHHPFNLTFYIKYVESGPDYSTDLNNPSERLGYQNLRPARGGDNTLFLA